MIEIINPNEKLKGLCAKLIKNEEDIDNVEILGLIYTEIPIKTSQSLTIVKRYLDAKDMAQAEFGKDISLKGFSYDKLKSVIMAKTIEYNSQSLYMVAYKKAA